MSCFADSTNSGNGWYRGNLGPRTHVAAALDYEAHEQLRRLAVVEGPHQQCPTSTKRTMYVTSAGLRDFGGMELETRTRV